MANTKRVQIRKGTELEHSSFTGALAEVTYDTDKGVIRMHDGTTTGGFEVLKARLTYVNSNFNARTNIKYLVDTSESSFTLTLPTLHNKGDIVQLFDSESFWSINNLIVITQNNEVIKDIEGYEDQTLVCDVSGVSIELIWEGNYWRLFQ
jgi:hypothetical protein